MSAGSTILGAIPVHNGARWIGQAVQSLLDQSRPPTRILVVGMPWASPDTSMERSAAAIIAAGLAAGVIGLALLARQKLPSRPVAAVQV